MTSKKLRESPPISKINLVNDNYWKYLTILQCSFDIIANVISKIKNRRHDNIARERVSKLHITTSAVMKDSDEKSIDTPNVCL